MVCGNIYDIIQKWKNKQVAKITNFSFFCIFSINGINFPFPFLLLLLTQRFALSIENRISLLNCCLALFGFVEQQQQKKKKKIKV